jgi:hypothetical protein
MVDPPLVLKNRVKDVWVDKVSFRMRYALLRGATSFVNVDPLGWNVATGMPVVTKGSGFTYPIVIAGFKKNLRCHPHAAGRLDCRPPAQILAVLPIFVSGSQPLLPVPLINGHTPSSAVGCRS